MNRRISPHQVDILNALAHGALMDIFHVLRRGLEPDDIPKALSAIRPILDKCLREAYYRGVGYKEALPDVPGS